MSNTRLLDPSIRLIWIQRVDTVDPHGTCLCLIRDLDSARQVLREAIRRFVNSQCRLVLELDDDGDRSKDLLVHELRIWLRVGDDSRLDPEALRAISLATKDAQLHPPSWQTK